MKALVRLMCAVVFLAGIALAQDDSTGSPSDQTPTFKVTVKLVTVYCTVVDAHGAPVTDLKKEDFTVTEDNVPQGIAVFDQESERPLNIVLALDTSSSVRKDLTLELNSAHHFIEALLRRQDALSLYQFSETVSEVLPFTSDMKRIGRALKGIQLGSGTALYDAVYLGGEALAPRQGRKVMVVITDGGDTMSQVRYGEALRSAQIADAIVYSIILVPIEASAGRNTGGEHALIQIATDTGGKYYYADSPQGLDTAFQQISKELRTQYLIGYYSNRRVADSDFRKIEVQVKPSPSVSAGAGGTLSSDGAAAGATKSELVVRHRAGYYTSRLK